MYIVQKSSVFIQKWSLQKRYFSFVEVASHFRGPESRDVTQQVRKPTQNS